MTKRIAHPEVIRECNENGRGWRVDEYGNWWPCSEETLMTKDELEERRRGDRQLETVDPATGELIERDIPSRALEEQGAS